MNKKTEHTKCLIIGSGPAGYTAAIYASRAGLEPVLYTGIQEGGQLTTTTDVDNFPGYPQGIMGPKLMEDLKKQAERFGTDVRPGTVTEVNFEKKPYKLTIDGREKITADSVIISTGASAKWLGIESEKKYNGLGVSACATCDGFFFRKQDVAVIGGGDTAAEEAIYLSKLCNKVYVIVRKGYMRASKAMTDRVEKTKNITILYNHETLEMTGDGKKITGIRLIDNKSKKEKTIDLEGIFVAIGHNPNTAIFEGKVDTDKDGYIITKPHSSHTNVEGVFAAGDVQDKTYRQAVSAAGSGCIAALDAERYLSMQD